MRGMEGERLIHSIRASVGQLAGRLFPSLHLRAWTKNRNARFEQLVASGDYKRRLGDLAVLTGAEMRKSHVVVVPQEGPDFESWAPGTRNFYYEAAQLLREELGEATVSVFGVEAGTASAEWHEALIRHVMETRATHIITHIEADPGSSGASWTWDVLWAHLHPIWDGVLLGVMFDSAYWEIRALARRLAKMSDHFMVVDICMPVDGSMVRGRPEVGPVNMPVSHQSMDLIDSAIADLPKVFDVSFIGALYPYRVEMLTALESRGLRVAVNPHRGDLTKDFAESRANQPSFIDYMSGLKQSELTINFSRSSAGPFEQLKTRVIESALAGCIVLTDDKNRTRLFLKPDFEYFYFNEPSDLPDLVERVLKDRSALREFQLSAAQTARNLAFTSFWSGIEEGLARRQLPLIFGNQNLAFQMSDNQPR